MASNCEDPRCVQKMKAGCGLFGYQSPPIYPILSREVYRWVQGLDLSYALKNPRRDCSNGFLVAELLSRYFPDDISMHSYRNGKSMRSKNDNWELLQRACRKHGFAIPADLVSSCVDEEFGAASALLELLYEHLTQRKIRRPIEVPTDTAAAASAMLKTSDATENKAAQFPGAMRATMVNRGQHLASEPKFGEVKQRALDDGVSLRLKMAASS